MPDSGPGRDGALADDDGDDRQLSTPLLGGLGWGVVVSVSLGVLLFVVGLSTGRGAASPVTPPSAAAAPSTAPPTTSTAPTTPAPATPPASPSPSGAPSPTAGAGTVLYDFDGSTQGWRLQTLDVDGSWVRSESSLPLNGPSSLGVRSASEDGQWISVTLDPRADLSRYTSLDLTISSSGATPLLGLGGDWGWCQVDVGSIPSGRIDVSFDLRDGIGPAGMECTPEKLTTVSTVNLWAPAGRSTIDDIRVLP